MSPPSSHEVQFEDNKETPFPYLYLDPPSSSDQPRPLLLVLHGRGERHGRNERGEPDKVRVLPVFQRPRGDSSRPFIVVAPICPLDTTWPLEIEKLEQLLKELVSRWNPAGVHLSGYSMGGFAAWVWAVKDPARFTTVTPICTGGGGTWMFDIDPPESGGPRVWPAGEKYGRIATSRCSENRIRKLRGMKIWAFHDPLDSVHSFSESEVMVNLASEAQADAVLSRVNSADADHHESWFPVYASDVFYDWLANPGASRTFPYASEKARPAFEAAAATYKPYYDVASEQARQETRVLSVFVVSGLLGNVVLAILMLQRSFWSQGALVAGVLWNALVLCALVRPGRMQSQSLELAARVLNTWRLSVAPDVAALALLRPADSGKRQIRFGPPTAGWLMVAFWVVFWMMLLWTSVPEHPLDD